ncbi:hypothetical protein M0R89_06845 [Halorussus limi]|uniref:DUF8070 domain-containing protein n=1 Tax=Halorussus limi TaxID=2938695 RepID=A0A8U0HXG0_9EURY|nr:hypothetical protein [Halorussus limi]UPV75770.1 hypothetical protein M0R89_06845 [Halorussus limi]
MDWEFLAHYGGKYTVLAGGGTVTVAYLLPRPFGPYALIGAIAVGMLLIGRAALDGGGGAPMSGGSPAGSAHALSEGSDGIFAPRESDDPLGVAPLFYAIGLVGFGIAALSTLL